MVEKLTYGISRMAYALKSVGDNNAISYGTPVALPGAYEISLPSDGDTVRVYADNVTYFKTNVNSGYDGNIGLYTLPDSFYTDILGQTKDTDGTIIEAGNDVMAEFALLGEFATETAQTKRFVFWNCVAGRPDFASSTKEETIEPNQLSIPITATALEGTEFIKGTILGDSTVAAWASWFTAVRMPALANAEGE